MHANASILTFKEMLIEVTMFSNSTNRKKANGFNLSSGSREVVEICGREGWAQSQTQINQPLTRGIGHKATTPRSTSTQEG